MTEEKKIINGMEYTVQTLNEEENIQMIQDVKNGKYKSLDITQATIDLLNNELSIAEHKEINNKVFNEINNIINEEIIKSIKTGIPSDSLIPMTANKKSIVYNIDLLKWYFINTNTFDLETEQKKAFNIMALAISEDPAIFMRIMLYIANTRKTTEQEMSYKMMIHFICGMNPDWTIANIQLLINLGKKDDVLYFLQSPILTKRVLTWVNHKVKEDTDYKNMIATGLLINKPIKRIIKYKPKLGKNYKWDIFLFKILDDSNFNGIAI